MSDPAFTQIATALKAALDAGSGEVFIDRDDAEPILPGERPAKVVRITDVQMTDRQEAGTDCLLCTASVDIDHYADTADSTDNINFTHNTMIAETVALLGADQSLGGTVIAMTPSSVTANADDVPDAGVAILSLELLFQIKLWDWTQIVFN